MYLLSFDRSIFLLDNFNSFFSFCICYFRSNKVFCQYRLSFVYDFAYSCFTFLQLTNITSEFFFFYLGKHFDRYYFIIVHVIGYVELLMLKVAEYITI